MAQNGVLCCLSKIQGNTMSLMKCPECGREISDKADKCPHCGAPNPNYDPDTPKPAELYTPCSKHPDKKSVLRCSACGKEMCSACGTNSKTFEGGEVLCPECYLEFLKKMNHDSKKKIIYSYIALALAAPFIVIAIFFLIAFINQDEAGTGVVFFWFFMVISSFFFSYNSSRKEENASGKEENEQVKEKTEEDIIYNAVKRAVDPVGYAAEAIGRDLGDLAGKTAGYGCWYGCVLPIVAIIRGPFFTVWGVYDRIKTIKQRKNNIKSSLPEIEEYERIVAERARAD